MLGLCACIRLLVACCGTSLQSVVLQAVKPLDAPCRSAPGASIISHSPERKGKFGRRVCAPKPYNMCLMHQRHRWGERGFTWRRVLRSPCADCVAQPRIIGPGRAHQARENLRSGASGSSRTPSGKSCVRTAEGPQPSTLPKRNKALFNMSRICARLNSIIPQ